LKYNNRHFILPATTEIQPKMEQNFQKDQQSE